MGKRFFYPRASGQARQNFVKQNSGGQAAITAVLFLLSISLVIGSGFAALGQREIQSSRAQLDSLKDYTAAESGVEDMVYRLANDVPVDASETLAVNGGTAVTTYATVNGDKQVTSQSAVSGGRKRVQVLMSGGAGITYGYGIQLGEGGFCMDSGAKVIGDVLTTGNVLGPDAGGCDRQGGGNGTADLEGNVSVTNGFQDDPDDQTEGADGAAYYDSTQSFGKTSPTIDIAQRITFGTSGPAGRMWLFLRKVGNPQPLGIRVVREVNGSPSTNPADVKASTTIAVSQILPFYTFVDVFFATSTTLTSGTNYWFVLDTNPDPLNYYEIGKLDVSSSNQKATADSTNGGASWSSIAGGDFTFRIWRGGINHKIDDMHITKAARAHTVNNSDVDGDVLGWSVVGGHIGGSVFADSIQNCTVAGNANYNTDSGCTVSGARNHPVTPPSDPAYTSIAVISPAQIQVWHDEAVAAGNQSCSNGEYSPADGITIGPKFIPCDLHIQNGRKIKLGGTVWVTGNIILDQNAVLMLAPSYGTLSGALVGERPLGEDNHTHIVLNQGVTICGSEGYDDVAKVCNATNGSYIHFIYLNEPLQTSIHIENNVEGRAVFYDPHGRVKIQNSAQVHAVVVSYEFHMYENSLLQFDGSAQSVGFAEGPPGTFTIKDWREVE